MRICLLLAAILAFGAGCVTVAEEGHDRPWGGEHEGRDSVCARGGCALHPGKDRSVLSPAGFLMQWRRRSGERGMERSPWI